MSEALERYRQRIARATAEIRLPGIHLRPDHAGAYFPLQSVYTRVQALWLALSGDTETEEDRSGKRWTLDPALIDVLRTVRWHGAEFYRRGQVYRALERPEPIMPAEAVRRHRQLVVLGVSGAGKSTLLTSFAHQAAEQVDGPAPILLSAYDYEVYVQAEGQDSVADFAMRQAAAGDPDTLCALQQAPTCVWLIDDLQYAVACRASLLRQLASLPGQVMITSSCAQYQHAGLEPFAPFEILPMTNDQIEGCLHEWLNWRAQLLRKGGNWVKDRMQWLETELNRRPVMRSVVRSPFLLMCALQICSDESENNRFPDRRLDLYDQWFQAALRPVAQFPGVSGASWSPDAIQRSFTHLVELLDRAPLQTFATVLESLATTLASEIGAANAPDQQTLSALMAGWLANGLLEERVVEDQKYLRVPHQNIREYALARSWSLGWQRDQQQVWERLRPYLHHEVWREAIVLMGEGLDHAARHELLQRIVHAGSAYERILHHDLRLATRLINACGESLDASAVAPIIRSIARMAKPQRNMRGIILPIVYGAGILGFLGVGLLTGPWLPLSAGCLLWTLFWAAMLTSYEFPGFQNLTFFPLRLWRSHHERTLFARLLGYSGHASAVPFLIEALHDEEPDIRRCAVETLDHIADIEAIPALLPLLHDADSVVRRTAALALGEIGAIPRLVQALNDSDGHVRNAAGEALERLSKAQAIPHLTLMLQDPKDYVRKASAQTLRRIGGERTVVPLAQALKDEHKEVRLIAAEALGEMTGFGDEHSRLQAKSELLKALQDSERSVRWAAAYALGKLDDLSLVPDLMQALTSSHDYVKRAITDALCRSVKVPSILYLLQALKDDDADIRLIAIEALHGICESQDVHFRGQLTSEIVPLLHDDSLSVRRSAAELLGLIGQPESVPALLVCLDDPEWQVRWAAAEALGKIGDPQAVSQIIPLLKDSHGYVCRAAAEALGKIGGQTAVPDLILALRSEKRYVQQAAEEALRLIGAAHTVPFLLQALKHEHDYVRQEAEAALRQVGQAEAAPYLVEALSDADHDVRRAAVLALGRIGEATAVPALIPLLQGEAETLRSAAAEALGEIGHSDAIPALIAALRDPENKVRRMAAKALGRLRAQDAAEPLLTVLNDENVNTRRVAVEALGRIASKVSVPALLKALQDEAWWLRWSAAYALGRIGDRQVIPQLLTALRDDNVNVRRATAEALGQLRAEEAVQPLIDALRDDEWWVRWASATALGQLQNPAALLPLIPVLQDSSPNVRRAAIEALGKIGSRQSAPYLIQGLRDGNWEVREAAANALRRLTDPAIIPDLLQAIKSGHAYVYKAATAALANIHQAEAIPYLLEGLQDDHDLVREAAAEHLVRRGGNQALRELLGTLQHDHWRVRCITAIVIGQMADSIDDVALLKRAARALWWRLTDKDDVAGAAFQALDMVVMRLAALTAV